MTGYMGLIRKDGREPWDVPGYKRASCEVCLANDQVQIPDMVIFDPVGKPGYGVISAWGLFAQAEGGEAVAAFPCWFETDAYEGTVPFVRAGELYLGVDISSQVKIVHAGQWGGGN